MDGAYAAHSLMALLTAQSAGSEFRPTGAVSGLVPLPLGSARLLDFVM